MTSSGVVASAILLLGVVVFAPPVVAGDLNPPGPPGPTMKTLDQIPPTWDQVLPAAARFKLVMGDTAVLDKETGLVWERSPDTNPRNWDSAWYHCVQRTVGSRRGWRLPTIQELASLVDPAASNPALPAGHPFTAVQLYAYWSSTIYPYDGGLYAAWFNSGMLSPYIKTVNTIYTWCVRGGRGPDGQ